MEREGGVVQGGENNCLFGTGKVRGKASQASPTKNKSEGGERKRI